MSFICVTFQLQQILKAANLGSWVWFLTLFIHFVCVVIKAHACHGTGVEVRDNAQGWLSLSILLKQDGLAPAAMLDTQASLASTPTLTIGVLELHMHGTTCGFLSFYFKKTCVPGIKLGS